MSQVIVSDTLQEWQQTAPYWTKHHNTIRTMFAPLTRALIKQAHIVEGQSVLDVAGGAGEPSLTIARAVWTVGIRDVYRPDRGNACIGRTEGTQS